MWDYAINVLAPVCNVLLGFLLICNHIAFFCDVLTLLYVYMYVYTYVCINMNLKWRTDSTVRWPDILNRSTISLNQLVAQAETVDWCSIWSVDVNSCINIVLDFCPDLDLSCSFVVKGAGSWRGSFIWSGWTCPGWTHLSLKGSWERLQSPRDSCWAVRWCKDWWWCGH